MATTTCTDQTQSLVDGFRTLTVEYQLLWMKSQELERNLKAAKEQFVSFVSQHGMVSKHDAQTFELVPPKPSASTGKSCPIVGAEEWWNRNDLGTSEKSLMKIRQAASATTRPKQEVNGTVDADKSTNQLSSTMPSISESPLEQDFTTAGTPSKLGCPFAAVAKNRRLSSHAASVLSKYRPSGTVTPHSSVSRINGRASSVAQASIQNTEEKQDSETCGAMVLPKDQADAAAADMESVQGSTAAGKCPIRFLEKSSPEDVAAYFEEHKHELPRSHEVCVKRYQSNAESIRQLDAKYGNLVSMIQGLGQKHAPMLPETPIEDEDAVQERRSNDRVRKWAKTINGADAVNGMNDADDERKPHFDRPMREVRIGESPSRPWGIQVPISAFDNDKQSQSSSAAAAVVDDDDKVEAAHTEPLRNEQMTMKPTAAKCPLGYDASKDVRATKKNAGHTKAPRPELTRPEHLVADQQARQHQPIFVNSGNDLPSKLQTHSQMTFTGPVLIGYSTEQAVAIIQALANNK